MTNSLLSILGLFDDEAIPVLAYKGPVLSQTVYDEFSLRQSRDLDLLVRPSDFYDIETVLVANGFEPERDLTEKQKQLLVRSGRDRTLKRDGLVVELHVRLTTPSPSFEVEELLERARPIELAGNVVPATRPADTLLVLSNHGTRHRWNQLKWICDIAYLIRNETFDWQELLEEAKRRNCYRRLLVACGLAATVLGVSVPWVVRSNLRASELRLIKNTYPNCLLGAHELASLRYRLRSRDDTLDRIRYCWGRLGMPPADETNALFRPAQSDTLSPLLSPLGVVTSKLRHTARAIASEVRRDMP
jgi:hypothetical protein